jgi:hypothetical protein
MAAFLRARAPVLAERKDDPFLPALPRQGDRMGADLLLHRTARQLRMSLAGYEAHAGGQVVVAVGVAADARLEGPRPIALGRGRDELRTSPRGPRWGRRTGRRGGAATRLASPRLSARRSDSRKRAFSA